MSPARRPRAIMLQATCSHAGKTVLVAGFCRLLARRGLRVAPFKSQNMSLNAHVAAGGGEMGWAEVPSRICSPSGRDPHRVESGGAAAGPGLLAVATTLTPEKVTRRVRARWRPDGPAFDGYEIHMGVTRADGAPRPLLEVEGRAEGCVSPDGRVWGTYVHGLFESGVGRRRVLSASPTSSVDSIDPRLLRDLGAA